MENDFISAPINTIKKISTWVEHLKSLEINALYLGPVFESSAHGYDTCDYRAIDRRLGTNEDFAQLCETLHANGIKVVLDGVFNHVGRNFAPFLDVCKNRYNSVYKDWFFVNFGGNSCYNDGFWYEGWEGHFELVKLNLRNPEVKQYLFESIAQWYGQFKIDGLRLDVAYCLDRDFVRELSAYCKQFDLFLLGEVVHLSENNKVLLHDNMLDSVTNYECYKGLFSSFNSANLFEIGHSINRLFGNDNWTLFKGKHLYIFADNHDVSRLASNIKNPKHVPLLYAILYMMPGIPSIYYGSEWEIEGAKQQGDHGLRPCLELENYPATSYLQMLLAKLGHIKKTVAPAAFGDYRMVVQTNEQYAFVRSYNGERVYCLVNASAQPFTFRWNESFAAKELLTNSTVEFSGSFEVAGYEAAILHIN